MALEDGEEITACFLHGPKDLKVERVTIQYPGPDELQIAVHSTGLCGSDLHYYNHGRNGDFQVREPLALGHESAGTVVATGIDVQDFRVGDNVALEVGVPCGECPRCREGRYNICKDMRFRSSAKSFPHFQGTLQSKINHPSIWCHKLPAGMTLDEGALLEPLGVAIHAANRAQLSEGASVLVLGAGAVGILAAAVAKSRGARIVVIADIDGGRAKFAMDNNFADMSFTIPPRAAKNTEEDIEVSKIAAACFGKLLDYDDLPIGEFDVVFECTGVPSCVQTAIHSARAGGKVMLIGMGSPVQTIPISAAALREVDILGVFRYASTYSKGIEIISNKGDGTMDFAKLITHKVTGLENAQKAFETAASTKDEHKRLVLKVVVNN